ncbi:O-methyltransferase [Actinomadura rayongensis]|uniref:O-methyltransferase n=1 Tax=Actinomadura rayongensis TaxID=1429076 RepID=A0A6I4WBY1_9ACTN|nr:O-methyltransferase [Actinomadura rayongensis]MXQ65785.1 O-methyltransferase [Actinomadura rayongensis]
MASAESVALTAELRAYVVAHGLPPDAVARRLIDRTAALGGVAEMQVPPEQGALLTWLARLLGARLAVEVGTFTGYSTLCLARGLAPGGRVVTFDLSQEWTAIARAAWREAGVDDRVDLRLGPAADGLAALPGDPVVDLAFIDADKPSYVRYWDLIVPRVRPGGLVLADNVLYGGAVADPAVVGNAAAIRAFNDRVRADPRVEAVLLPIADGLTLARRLPDPTGGGS